MWHTFCGVNRAVLWGSLGRSLGVLDKKTANGVIFVPMILAAEYAAGSNDRDQITSSSAFILYCQKGVGGMGEATK